MSSLEKSNTDPKMALDPKCCIILANLPSSWIAKSAEDFENTVSGIMTKTFRLDKDGIFSIVRYPRLNPYNKELGVRCLISFHSQLSKHRVMSQKIKLDPPAALCGMHELPKEIYEEPLSNEQVQEVLASLKIPQDGQQTLSGGSDSEPPGPGKTDAASSAADIASAGSTVLGNEVETDKTNGEHMDDDVGEGAGTTDNVVRLYAHSICIYPTLPIKWEGAPEFRWRICTSVADEKLLLFEDVLPEDLYHPWIYPAILRAHRVITDFPTCRDMDSVLESDLYGRIEAYFPDDRPLSSCVLIHLVHVRTPPHRKIKIFLPRTKFMLSRKKEFEERLGRYREPIDGMRQIVLKPIEEYVTEEVIRTTAFKNHPFESVRFDVDPLNLRMATVTFATAERAIAVHRSLNAVHFGKPESPTNWATVYYVYVDMKDWGHGNPHEAGRLLTHAQLRVYRKQKEKLKNAQKMKDFEEAMKAHAEGKLLVTPKEPHIKKRNRGGRRERLRHGRGGYSIS